jgi:molybdenum cofactor synthesis domain-containing protein
MPEMIEVGRALDLVLDAAVPLEAQRVPLDACAGRILEEEIRAAADVPAFDKALMDGVAVIASDLDRPPRDLRLVGTIPAGTNPARLPRVEPGTAARIMTGAPLPPGADAVLMVERTGSLADEPGMVRCLAAVRAGANLARRGDDVRAGDVLLLPGDFIGAGEIGVLAACGRTTVRVGGRPRVAVLATGDEIVPAGETPGQGRIRDSNRPVLAALARRAGAEVVDLGIAPDDEAALAAAVGRGLQADMLLMSGGVSMGERDLVGGVLRRSGVEVVFDRVAIKPGKPFTFGRHGATLVCACPGNPVSGYVAFHLFAAPALRRMMGHREPGPRRVAGVLARPLRLRPGRAACMQARARFEDGRLVAEVLPTSGSADFVSCARGNALVLVAAGDDTLPAGAAVEVILLEDFAER